MSGVEPWRANSIEERTGDRQGGTTAHSEMQLFFLLRLDRLLRVRREHAAVSNATDWWAKLLNRAIYSTYCDCIETGVGDEARTQFSRDQKAAQN